jgi:hypothetical protein
MHHCRGVIALGNNPQVAGISCGLLSRVIALEVDKLYNCIYSSNAFVRVAALYDQPLDLLVYIVVYLRKLSRREL